MKILIAKTSLRMVIKNLYKNIDMKGQKYLGKI